MKITAIVVGGVLVVLGLVWMLQGLNIFAGSSMSGQTLWATIGSIVAVVGLIFVIVGARLQKKE